MATAQPNFVEFVQISKIVMLLFKDIYEEFHCERKRRILWTIALPIFSVICTVQNSFGTFGQHLLCDIVICLDASFDSIKATPGRMRSRIWLR